MLLVKGFDIGLQLIFGTALPNSVINNYVQETPRLSRRNQCQNLEPVVYVNFPEWLVKNEQSKNVLSCHLTLIFFNRIPSYHHLHLVNLHPFTNSALG